ncbi:signal peptidase I SipW [Fictibacillus phosphorivorans]|uniref:signal peptidase I SipW n=1 Tax=Fictibacillus phosphorivorans TaxID=1221500 RepID=UPI00203D68B1|nr:signal peptidase I [Fictibacillus phosphorivorans]MCM3718508.1 signal peptidase I [Fictibacillus phosphorivorans]MCM3776136.1 signal peptidase I [Fictibacillus phosphorivorans]
MKLTLKILNGLLTVVLAITLLGMIFVVISTKSSGGEPKIFGYQLKTVLSGSMEPTFKTGSIIAVKPLKDTSNLKKSDIVTFLQQDQTMVTHRIIEVIKNGEQTMYQTKGDNNKDVDGQPVLAQNVVAKYSDITVPYLGYFIDFAKSNKGTAMLLIIPGVLLLIYSAISILRALKELDRVNKNSGVEKTA